MDNAQATQAKVAVKEKELRRSISTGHNIANHLQAIGERARELRTRLLAPVPEAEDDSPDAPVGSELGEMEAVLRAIQRVTNHIDEVLSDLERI